MTHEQRSQTRLSELPPEELERMARAHVEAMWAELRAAGTGLRASCHPANVARRHPLATAAAVGALAGILLRRRRRPAPAPEAGGGRQGFGHALARSVASNLAAAAGRAVPALAGWWAARRSRHGHPPDATQ